MFRIGEFSQIARVSGRLLRYYDGIGLLRPVRIDPATGYRYYSAGQLPRLNSILALKELGLSLDQIAKMVDAKIAPEEIRGMLMLKEAELERTLSEEASRLRHIESRLQQVDEQGSLRDYDVIVKSAPAQPYLSVRRTFPRMENAVGMLRDVARTVAAKVPRNIREKMVVVAYSDFEDEDLDLEIGVSLTQRTAKRVVLPGAAEMTLTELPAVESLARESAASDLLTFSTEPSNVDRGLAMGMEMDSGRPRFVVNLAAAASAGASFESGFLNLCRIVEK